MTAQRSPDATDQVNGVPVARRIPLRGIQRVVANRTLAGIQSTAHVTAMAEVDAEPVLTHARELRETDSRADAHSPPDQGSGRLPAQAPAPQRDDRGTNGDRVCRGERCRSAGTALGRSPGGGDQARGRVPACRDRDAAAVTPATSRGRRPVHRRCPGRNLYPEQLRHAAHRDLGDARAHPRTGRRTRHWPSRSRRWWWTTRFPRAGVCGVSSRSRSPTTTAS